MWVRCFLLGICATVVLSGCQKQANNDADSKATETTAENVKVAGGKEKGKDVLMKRPMKFTYMAMCQMRCAKLRTSNIKEAFQNGAIKTSKKWLGAKPCPFYAVETKNAEGKRLTVVISVCEKATRVVRVMQEGADCKCQEKGEKKS